MKPPILRSLLVPALLTSAALLFTALRPPRAGEPLPMGWVRTAASHPWRTGVALALLTWAIWPPPSPRFVRELPKRPGPTRGQGPEELG